MKLFALPVFAPALFFALSVSLSNWSNAMMEEPSVTPTEPIAIKYTSPNQTQITYIKNHPIFGNAWCYRIQLESYSSIDQVCWSAPHPDGKIEYMAAKNYCLGFLNAAQNSGIMNPEIHLPTIEDFKILRNIFGFKTHSGYKAEEFYKIFQTSETNLIWMETNPIQPKRSRCPFARYMKTSKFTPDLTQMLLFVPDTAHFVGAPITQPVGTAQCIEYTHN